MQNVGSVAVTGTLLEPARQGLAVVQRLAADLQGDDIRAFSPAAASMRPPSSATARAASSPLRRSPSGISVSSSR